MIDSGPTSQFISQQFAEHFKNKELSEPETLNIIDRTKISSGKITHTVSGWLELGAHHKVLTARVVQLEDYDLVLGIPWLRDHNPAIDWKEGHVEFEQDECDWHMRQQAPSVIQGESTNRPV
jgi:hypothetical protein